MSLVIVNTSCANLASVDFAFKRLGVSPLISADPAVIRNAERVVLPGVGTAGAAMRELNRLQLVGTLQRLSQPLLGICLGMQMLTRESEEQRDGQTVPCLSVIPTRVERMQNALNMPLPHMGWNRTEVSEHPLFKGFGEGTDSPYFYYVHSFAAPLSQQSIARCDYTQPFSAAIAQNNFMGVQFHPERSGDAGAQVLQNFLEISC